MNFRSASGDKVNVHPIVAEAATLLWWKIELEALACWTSQLGSSHVSMVLCTTQQWWISGDFLIIPPKVLEWEIFDDSMLHSCNSELRT
jgi:hypothetical protein